MAILNIKDLSWKYSLADERTLKRISLTLEKGQFLGIVGPNEAGKTTLAKAMAGLIPNKYNGEIHGHLKLAGLDTRENNMGEIAKKTGMVFSNPLAQMTGSKMTVREEIAFGLEQLGVEREEMERRVQDMLEWTKLTEAADRSPVQVSGGQKQKIAIASLLVMEPEVLILDEPTTMLDPIGTKKVFELLEKLEEEKNITTILISHKFEKIAKYADKCVVVHDGKIKERGTPKEIFTKMVDDKFLLEKYELAALPITKLAYKLKKDSIWKNELPTLLEEAKKGLKEVGLK